MRTLLRYATRVALLLSAIVTLAATSASAETLMMPKPRHVAGGSQVVWGVTTLPNHTAASPTTYAIDFGDGSAPRHRQRHRPLVHRRHPHLPRRGHVHGDAAGHQRRERPKRATVACASSTRAVIAAEQLRGVRINSAIEDGLRFLWVNQANRAHQFPERRDHQLGQQLSRSRSPR